ncbi:MAG: hypothetical protein HY329_28190 [Chloroflexi bacterium]|nr:hypothetical protein [Chloroflexota bacterium]
MIAPARLLWLIAAPLDAAAGAQILSSSGLPPIAIAMHVTATALFGLSLLTHANGRRIWAWSWLGWTLSLLSVPPLGLGAVTVAFLLTQTRVRRRTPAETELAELAQIDEPEVDPVARAHQVEVALLDELEIEPIVDVLRENDPELKRAAIELLTKRRNSSSVRILIGLLHDPVPEARFFASIGLSKLEDEFSRLILEAQRQVTELPTSAAAHERLAELYLEYAESGFLEGVTRAYYLDLARQSYEQSLSLSTERGERLLRLARSHLLMGNIAEAAFILDEQARQQPASVDVHLLRMNVIFQFGDFRELAIYAGRALSSIAPETETRELIEWWAIAGQTEARVEVS